MPTQSSPSFTSSQSLLYLQPALTFLYLLTVPPLLTTSPHLPLPRIVSEKMMNCLSVYFVLLSLPPTLYTLTTLHPSSPYPLLHPSSPYPLHPPPPSALHHLTLFSTHLQLTSSQLQLSLPHSTHLHPPPFTTLPSSPPTFNLHQLNLNTLSLTPTLSVSLTLLHPFFSTSPFLQLFTLYVPLHPRSTYTFLHTPPLLHPRHSHSSSTQSFTLVYFGSDPGFWLTSEFLL
ncbi:hypothetical protein Pcinc_036033 [Petrolisthes cinctipes]|uniref:Uncharacterized protein n=1 Tax=Petrolisthes cinctipes TaxID=88211 RepID=A0AAE1EP10_PETCI|nr:hypothetical protein Pcinc_036033 [Petrolisthes cinctipes]